MELCMRASPRLLWLTTVSFSLVVAACGGDGKSTDPGPEPAAEVASVTVSPAADTVLVHATVQLAAVARDADGTAIPGAPITWTTSDETHATVSADGTVTAHAMGSVTVTATAQGKSASATLTLAPLIVIAPRLPSLFAGDTTLLVAKLTDATGAPLSGSVTWTSENDGVATIAQDGVVSGHAPGTARLLATLSGGQAAIEAAVLPSTPRANRELAMLRVAQRFDGLWLEELWTMAADGSQFVRVSESDEFVESYAWSRDGSAFVVSFIRAALGDSPWYGRNGLYVMVPTGANLSPLLTTGTSPDWSPDGQQIAYTTSLAHGTRIMLGRSDGSGEVALIPGTTEDSNPQWSPDGRRIAWRRDAPFCSEIWVADADGAHASRLDLPVGACSFAWSPDGKQLAVNAYLGINKPSGIWLVNSDGTGARPFTPNCTAAPACTGPYASGAVWSPDGSQVAYVQSGVPSIVIAAKNGSGSTTLDVPASCCTAPTSLAWSPDGQWLAFETTGAEDGPYVGRIGMIAATGGAPTLLTPAGVGVGTPRWQP
jgi:dipeptidyl aminopeptidase/acylaminoacyl peptidase